MNLSSKYGIGEVYRVYVQMQLFDRLKNNYGFKNIVEFPKEKVSSGFPITWEQIEPNGSHDCLFTWRSSLLNLEIISHFWKGKLIVAATNINNPGAWAQKLYWKEFEVYHNRSSLEKLCKEFNIEVIESGYYDCPPWFDMPLGSSMETSRHINLPDNLIRKLLFFEKFPLKFLRAHHPFVYGVLK